MNELIKINSIGYGDVPTVSGRELHEALEINSNYTTWFNRMCEYGFVEGEDFITCFPNLESENQHGGQNKIDHLLTIDTAKEICMIQRTETGRTIRRYFIETEKQYKQQSDNTFLLKRQNELEKRIEKLENGKQLPVQDIKNPVHTFIKECCVMRASYRDGITTAKLYKAFEMWSRQNTTSYAPSKSEFIAGMLSYFNTDNKKRIRKTYHGYRYYIITLNPHNIGKLL